VKLKPSDSDLAMSLAAAVYVVLWSAAAWVFVINR
jgi:hypothetical protein